MGLWGKSSNWRSTRERFQRLLVTINFERASKEALRNIARRYERKHGLRFRRIEAIVSNNPET